MSVRFHLATRKREMHFCTAARLRGPGYKILDSAVQALPAHAPVTVGETKCIRCLVSRNSQRTEGEDDGTVREQKGRMMEHAYCLI